MVFSENFFKHMIDTGAMESILRGVDEPEDDSVDWQGTASHRIVPLLLSPSQLTVIHAYCTWS